MTITDSRAASDVSVPLVTPPRGSDSHPTSLVPTPKDMASGGDQLAGGQYPTEARQTCAAGNQLTDRRDEPGTRELGAVGTSSRSATAVPLPDAVAPSGAQPTGRRVRSDDHTTRAVGADGGQGQTAVAAAVTEQAALFDPALALAADVLDDVERVRVANENRLRQLTRSVEDSDGEERGFGLDESHPDVARLAAMVELLKTLDKDATKNLEKVMRRHPLAGWAKAQRGVGDKQVARLLAAIGDPYINSSTGLPRTVSALWAYCGLHVLPAGGQLSRDDREGSAAGRDGGDPGQVHVDAQNPNAGVAPKRARGQRANWSTNAKTRAYLIATSCLKQLVKPCETGAHVEDCACSPYRLVYERRRAHTSVTRPEWTDGHSHNDALRVAAKEVLKDLWRAAREHHNPPE